MPAAPGTTTPGARVVATVAAFAVALSPAGASSDVPQAVPVPLPGQLTLFGPEVA